MFTLASLPKNIQTRLDIYAKTVGCSLVQVIQVAIADFIEFEGRELGGSLNTGIFEGLSDSLQNAGQDFLNETYGGQPDAEEFNTDFLVQASIHFFLHPEAARFDDPLITSLPMIAQPDQVKVLEKYLGTVPIAA